MLLLSHGAEKYAQFKFNVSHFFQCFTKKLAASFEASSLGQAENSQSPNVSKTN